MLKKTNILILTLLASGIKSLDTKFNAVKNGKTHLLFDLEQALKIWPMSLVTRSKNEKYVLPIGPKSDNVILNCKYIDIIENLPIVIKLKGIFSKEVFNDFLDVFYWYIGEPVVEYRDALDLRMLRNPTDYIESLFDGTVIKNETVFSLGGYDFNFINDESYNYLFSSPKFFAQDTMDDEVLLLDSLNRPFSYTNFKDIGNFSNLIVANYSTHLFKSLSEANIQFCLRLNSLHDIYKNIFTKGYKISLKLMEQYKNNLLGRPFLLRKTNINYKKYYLYCYFVPTGDEVRTVKRDLLVDFWCSPKNEKHCFEIFQETYVRFFLSTKKLVLKKLKLLPVYNSDLEWNQYVLNKVNYISESLTKGHTPKSIYYLGLYLLFVEAALSDITSRINTIMQNIYSSNHHYSLKDVVEILKFNESLSGVKMATYQVSPSVAVTLDKLRYYKKFLELLASIIKINQ
ncbi:hypothetical protein ACNQ2I_01995 [Mycoplasma sp. Z355B]|uniref:hypothetical protein n=1 Tax=unclassified Mycoplasma TaxID=2683645 RepID=UPI003AAE9D6B